jgi:hypothetical protein
MFPMDNNNLWPGFHGRTNTDIINQWLAGDCPTGRSSHGSVSFAGDTIYTCEVPLARKINGLFLVNSRRYSVTSNRHKTRVLRSLPPTALVLYTEDVTAPLPGPWLMVTEMFDLKDTCIRLVAADWCAEHGYTEVEAALRASVPDRDQ